MANRSTKPASHTLSFEQLLEDLTGEKSTLYLDTIRFSFFDDTEGIEIGYTQFNEILLTYGYHRISQDFFQFLVDGTNDVDPHAKLNSQEQLRQGIERFRKVALFAYGNIKYAFKKLSTGPEILDFWLVEGIAPIEPSVFFHRQKPLRPIQEIPGDETYYLGYLVQDAIDKALEEDTSDPNAIAEKMKCDQIIKKGIENYSAYLASDFIDIYVATSMREKHEYCLANKWINEIFCQDSLNSLKLRWFDPTQAYCLNRIDKGLFEGLMLKRATCTIYFVQETDTLGKDSELASTLAQGKPVIAFLPTITDQYVEDFLGMLTSIEPQEAIHQIILKQLRVFDPASAWSDPEIQEWLTAPYKINLDAAKIRLKKVMEKHYNRRAEVLSASHPLGLQVNLQTGVANGVLVVRNVKDCGELIYRIMTRAMEFSLKEVFHNGKKYIYLIEDISQCIYRVVTGDTELTNSFWNYYLKE
jgi:hypothetical protein